MFKRLALLLSIASPAVAGLPPLDLAPTITVSGISSGGYMAGQFHMAHAKLVDGAAIIAAGPWGCAGGELGQALAACVDKTDQPIDLAALTQAATQGSQADTIDGPGFMSDDKVWLLHGSLDTRVAAGVSDALFQQYQSWIKANNLVYLNDQPFHHTLPTLNQGSGCDESVKPWLGRCNYDAAGALLEHLLGDLTPAAPAAKARARSFNQRDLGGADAHTLAEEGYLYIPQACAEGQRCRLHVSFHGCQQQAENIGTAYVDHAGFNRWADANNLVILYPQTESSLFSPMNPKACWDWWGYTGADYLSRSGAQINAVYTMVQFLMGKPASP